MKPHHIKFAVGAPIIFVLLLNQSGVSTSTVNSVALSSSHTRFAEVGEVLEFSIDAQSLIPMNAIGVSLSFPKDIVSIESIDQEKTIVDLWVEEPNFSNEHGTAKMSGGLLGKTGFIGRGHIATVRFKAIAEGKAPISIGDAVLLARDGKGTNILEAKENITFIIRDKGEPTPDLNGDGVLSFADVTLLYFASLRSYQEAYDFTHDGKVSFSDVLHLGKLLRE
jgi:hypothetical protein